MALSDHDLLAQIARDLGEIHAAVDTLRQEVHSLRQWRHDLVDKFGAISTLPAMIAHISTDLNKLLLRVEELERKIAAWEGERAARDHLAEWMRWLVPAGGLAAIAAAVWAWLVRR